MSPVEGCDLASLIDIVLSVMRFRADSTNRACLEGGYRGCIVNALLHVDGEHLGHVVEMLDTGDRLIGGLLKVWRSVQRMN